MGHRIRKNLTRETVEHPQHYNAGKFEAIAVIDDWRLNFCVGNAVKYIARADHKGHRLLDLRKAVWYLNHEIARTAKPARRTKGARR